MKVERSKSIEVNLTEKEADLLWHVMNCGSNSREYCTAREVTVEEFAQFKLKLRQMIEDATAEEM